jgi:hypothetical protein
MSQSIHIHFIYGSVPLKEFRYTGEKVPGGLLGGHIYLQKGQNVFGFEPIDRTKIHLFPRKKFNSRYTKEDYSDWYQHIRNKKLVSIEIPLSDTSGNYLNILLENFHRKTPYDYAVFGMRCGASTYQILSEAGLFPLSSGFKAMLRVPVPGILRKKLLKIAEEDNLKITRQAGNQERKWEND